MAYETFKLRRACQIIMELAQLGNVYFDTKKPWQLAKQPETKAQLETALSLCLEAIKALALISWPIIPETAEKVWHMLGYSESLASQSWQGVSESSVPSGQALKEPVILFSKIEDEQIEKEISKLHEMSSKGKSEKSSAFSPLKPMIGIDDVRKLDLRVGIVKKAQAVAKSKKLLQLEIDLGFETRTVLSGISQNYKPEELMGKKIVLVANLKPATLMGLESQGMILCGGYEDQLELISLQDLPPGAEVS